MTHDTYIFVKLRNGGAVLADLIVKNNAGTTRRMLLRTDSFGRRVFFSAPER